MSSAAWRGATPADARGEIDSTPLHWAARWGGAAAIEALLGAGADSKARDADGRVAFDLIDETSALKNTDAYWRLHDLRFD